ncbi:LamG-like jellyroll fold domain-containing protein [Haloarchaeobius amylolyticus]|uniref:LamG-like jellyroll fold domain-containing protein n=1 Tax=Haloarchaeobius amylolyticus TaxID=1198296 RepID=A0ABD6BDE1_9EURY
MDRDGLIAFYPMEEKKGSILLVDESKNGNDGRIYGPTRIDGNISQALAFDIGDHVEVRGHSKFNFDLDDFASCFFLLPQEEGTVLQKSDNESGYEIRIEDSKIKASFWDDVGSTQLEAGISIGEEYFIAVVREAGNARLYINSKLRDLGDAELELTNTEPLLLGDMTDEGFSGILDEIYFYDRNLSQREVRNIYQKYVGTP